MNNENSINSAKIDSQYFYNSQDSKVSRTSRKSENKENINSVKSPFDSDYLSRKEQRGGYSHSLDSGVRLDTIKQVDKNIFDSNTFSEIENRIKRAPKNFVPPQHMPKKNSIRTIKGNLYEALNNLNKELNVKIEKREIPKIRMSLLDYLYHNTEDQQANNSKHMSKKIDIDNVMENLNNIAKDKVTNENNQLNLSPLNITRGKEIEMAEETNIEKLLNKTNPFIATNNMETLYFSGIRLANEVDKNKLTNQTSQIHSNYSSIHVKQSSLPYHKKKKNTKSLTIDDAADDVNKYVKSNSMAYNSQRDVDKLNEEIVMKVKTGDVDVKYNSVYVRNKVSPNRKIVRKESNTELEKGFLEENFVSNFEMQSLLNYSINLPDKENLNMFTFNPQQNMNDHMEKEIFENLIKNEVIKYTDKKIMMDNLYSFDFRSLLNMMKQREIEFSNVKNELMRVKNDMANLKRDAENKINIKGQDLTDSELKFKVKELESQLNTQLMNNSKLEKENGILKNELVNNKKNKNLILKKLNEEMTEMTKITQEFFENFMTN